MRRKLTALLLALCMVLCLASGCDTAGNIDDDQPKAEDVTVRVGAMNGPTAMGMVKLMDDAENGKTSNEYEFSLETGADVFAPALAKGELDIAAVPANLASILYNNTDGGVKVIAVNTLGVLYVVERGDTVKSLQDLKGKTIHFKRERNRRRQRSEHTLVRRYDRGTVAHRSRRECGRNAAAALCHGGAEQGPRTAYCAQLKRGVGSTRKRLCDGDWRSGGAQRVCAATPRTA